MSQFAVAYAVLSGIRCVRRLGNALRTAHVTTPIARLIRDDCLVLVVRVPAGLTICLSLFIAIFATEGTIRLLPFHFPLAVFEFRHGYPGFIAARCWRRIREVRIGCTRAP